MKGKTFLNVSSFLLPKRGKRKNSTLSCFASHFIGWDNKEHAFKGKSHKVQAKTWSSALFKSYKFSIDLDPVMSDNFRLVCKGEHTLTQCVPLDLGHKEAVWLVLFLPVSFSFVTKWKPCVLIITCLDGIPRQIAAFSPQTPFTHKNFGYTNLKTGHNFPPRQIVKIAKSCLNNVSDTLSGVFEWLLFQTILSPRISLGFECLIYLRCNLGGSDFIFANQLFIQLCFLSDDLLLPLPLK